MRSTFDAVVVGAGIVGAACAWELSNAGLRVAVYDSGIAGGGATAAGMGHIALMDDSEPQFALTRYSQLLWRDLSSILPSSAEYLRCGAIWVAAGEEDLREVRRKERFYSDRGVPVETLDSGQLSEAEPNLRRGLIGGLLLCEDAVCYPPVVTRFLLERAVSQGATWMPGTAVHAIDSSGVTVNGGTRLSNEIVIWATGASAAALIPELPVIPRKGHLVITDRYSGFLRHQLIELGYLRSAHAVESDSVAFNVQPRVTGQILIGSSRQFGVDTPGVDSAILSAMLRRAAEYMPGVTALSAIRVWTGFRAATPDKLPLIGRYPAIRGLYLATGHEGLGISTSLATARLLADEILGRTSEIPREPYAPERSFVAHA